ncbi:PH domain-containing protein [Streptomyces europaeiscabiei]|uniref:PH domain-containing protein n=1 Tax=Streptomyces europaeiscabiei TaxID=146819 RepID=UPI000A6ACF60|nr:PH domain-containing protein [Streptomyces europaeiscabiei]
MSDGIERDYRRRRGIPPGFLTTLLAAGLVSAGALHAMATLGPSGWDVLAVVAWLAVAGRVVLEQWRARTSVTADGVTVRGVIRTRSWAWSDITASGSRTTRAAPLAGRGISTPPRVAGSASRTSTSTG